MVDVDKINKVASDKQVGGSNDALLAIAALILLNKDGKTVVDLDPVTIAQLPTAPGLASVRVISDGAAGHSWGDSVGADTPGSTKYLVWWNGSAWTVIGK